MKSLLRLLLQWWFDLRAEGENHLQQPGPMVLAPNHVSWLDWLFIGVFLGDDWKFVASSTTAQASWVHRKIMVNRRTFPVDPTSAYSVRDMSEFLQRGGKLVIFPEGQLSKTGGLMKIYDGLAFLLQRTGAPVVTCYLRNAKRVRWVRHSGWTQWRPRVSVHFSEPKRAPHFPALSSTVARQRVTRWLRDEMVSQQFRIEFEQGPKTVLAALAEIVGAQPNRLALEDPTLTKLSYRKIALATEVLAGLWRRRLGREVGERVGVLLPNANATPLALFSLWRAGKTPAILNFSSGVPTMTACAKLAGVTRVVTSRRFIELAKLDLKPLTDAGIELHVLEDVRGEAGWGLKLSSWLRAHWAPGENWKRLSIEKADTAVILFTSGSEGVPKGVELTHGNLLANAWQCDSVFDLTDDDRFFSALPLFHSLGLVGGLLFPLLRGCYTFLYPTPLHYRIIPTLVYDKQCTVMLATNTFLNGYGRKANPYDFRSLRLLVAGAEKVQSTTFETWSSRFGVRILEGYGATECSPVISVNSRIDPKIGSAGRVLPGIEWKLESVEGVEKGGRLWVRGPNIMKGYLNLDAQEKFLAGAGWYDTGDVVEVDDEGFLHIRGRMKRFAKISGEMVSLTAVEDALAGAFPQYGARCQIAVLAVPDADKGEKLIAATNEHRLQLADMRAALRAKGLNNLSAPRELVVLTPIPKLGTGKTDYREITRQLAARESNGASGALAGV